MYSVNQRIYSVFSSLTNELQYEPNKNYLFDLSYLGVIDVIGERAHEFLQGQLSCDVREVNTQQMRQGAQCNLKGRILSLEDVVDWQGLRLILPLDLIDATIASLKTAAMLSRVQLQKASTMRVLGLLLADEQDYLPPQFEPLATDYQLLATEQLASYRLDKQHYIVLTDTNNASSMMDLFTQRQQARGSLAWHARQLEQGRIEIYPESRGLFLPHRVNLHQSGYISFNKGCYKGQEIIARTHYRATLKHSLQIFTHSTESTLLSGMLVHDKNTQTEVGELIDFCPIKPNHYLVAASLLNDSSRNLLIS